MFEWSLSGGSSGYTVAGMILRLGLAWCAGLAVASFSRWRRREVSDDTLPATLVLMAILIAMATQIIGDNVARAFSLVGALSIVRFRTAVPSTQDVAWVLTSVVVGMAIGAGQLAIAALGLCVVGAAALGWQNVAPPAPLRASRPFSRLTLQIAIGAQGGCLEVMERIFDDHELMAIETVRKGSAMSYHYRVTLRPGLAAIDAIAELARLPVVESVAWDAEKGN